MIALEVSDLRLDRAAATSALSFGAGRILLALPRNVNFGPAGVAMTSIAFVDSSDSLNVCLR